MRVRDLVVAGEPIAFGREDEVLRLAVWEVRRPALERLQRRGVEGDAAPVPRLEQTINDIALRHGFSSNAVLSMLELVINGNGNMAQFSHPEFSGSGQWMRGGMIMVSDMFNNALKSRIDGLCVELSNLVASQPNLIQRGSFQSQSQGGQAQGSSNAAQQQRHHGSTQQQSVSGPWVQSVCSYRLRPVLQTVGGQENYIGPTVPVPRMACLRLLRAGAATGQ